MTGDIREPEVKESCGHAFTTKTKRKHYRIKYILTSNPLKLNILAIPLLYTQYNQRDHIMHWKTLS